MLYFRVSFANLQSIKIKSGTTLLTRSCWHRNSIMFCKNFTFKQKKITSCKSQSKPILGLPTIVKDRNIKTNFKERSYLLKWFKKRENAHSFKINLGPPNYVSSINIHTCCILTQRAYAHCRLSHHCGDWKRYWEGTGSYVMWHCHWQTLCLQPRNSKLPKSSHALSRKPLLLTCTHMWTCTHCTHIHIQQMGRNGVKDIYLMLTQPTREQ